MNEVKILGLMLLLRLGQVSPESVIPRLDEVVESLKGMMKDVEVKEDTVKQDLERKGGCSLASSLQRCIPEMDRTDRNNSRDAAKHPSNCCPFVQIINASTSPRFPCLCRKSFDQREVERIQRLPGLSL